MDRLYYAVPDPWAPELESFYGLSPSYRRKVLEYAETYMKKIEIIKCPWCKDSKRHDPQSKYDGDNLKCVRCWYRYLNHLSEEAAKGGGLNDGK